MRILFSIVALLGLLLIGFSMFEIRAAIEYRSNVSEVQQLLTVLGQFNQDRARLAGGVFTGTSLAQEYGSRLDGVDRFERGWLIIAFVGTFVFFAGIAGFIIERRRYVQRIAA
jgi:di/tricarboxylate transporter